MSITTSEILLMMASVGGRIAVLQGPTAEYKEYIVICRADGVAVGILTRDILDDLIEADLVEKDDEDESKAIFRLSDCGKDAAKIPLKKYLKARLISLGYPWPDNLDTKSIAWLEAEIRAITPELEPVPKTPS